MTEIKTFTKIAILAYGIVSLIFAIILIFLTDLFLAALNMPTWQNPTHPRMFGGALLVVFIFAVSVLIHKDWDWEKIKFAYQILYIWIPINIAVEAILGMIILPELSINAISETLLDIIIMTVLGILGIIAFIKQKD
ncbi:MAG: hypothetical protein EU531_05575 [Promethearchaeota archaeon]|nr:MAG: hypothetical protein EU531_05575 [Candidatus Lokiarchaeota archaeon]